MNEIHSYDPEMYHATLTHSIYVRLEGSVLRLSKPNRNISRRAAHNEPKPDVTYISQKIYDLTDSKVRRVRVLKKNNKKKHVKVRKCCVMGGGTNKHKNQQIKGREVRWGRGGVNVLNVCVTRG